MSENVKYVLTVCETLIDDKINRRTRSGDWFSVLELMQGTRELKDILNTMDARQDDGK